MIGEIVKPLRTDRCNRCRFWLEHMPLRDPNDQDWGTGECRFNPPVLVSSMVGIQIDRPRFGQTDELEIEPIALGTATRFPVTSSTDWCGRHTKREG